MSNQAVSLTQSDVVRVRQIGPGAFAVTIDNPPFNVITPKVLAGLKAARRFAEDPANDVRVFVFESANPEFFGAHVDLVVADDLDADGAVSESADFGQWPELAGWLSTGPVVTMAILRGRTRGFGCEFASTLDMRFASKENLKLCLLEVGFGAYPGGGGIEWAQVNAGRARAMEFVLSADDYDGETAELYGLVNRALPDAELDAYVYKLARRIGSFNPASILAVKASLTKQQPVPTAETLAVTFGEAMQLQGDESCQEIATRLITKAGGFPFSYEVELDLPKLYAVD